LRACAVRSECYCTVARNGNVRAPVRQCAVVQPTYRSSLATAGTHRMLSWLSLCVSRRTAQLTVSKAQKTRSQRKQAHKRDLPGVGYFSDITYAATLTSVSCRVAFDCLAGCVMRCRPTKVGDFWHRTTATAVSVPRDVRDSEDTAPRAPGAAV